MTSELDGPGEAPEPRDYTKWVWAGVVLLVAAMGLALYLNSGLNPQVSMARARHILVKFDERDPADRGQALARIRDIRERVLKGEDFAKLARDNSNDPGSASKGGDLGYVKKSDLDPVIDSYVWSAPVGQLSDVLTTKFGFHIVVVVDRQLSAPDALEEQRRGKGNLKPAEGGVLPAPSTSQAPK